MAISPPSDIVLDVARAVEPAGVEAARAALVKRAGGVVAAFSADESAPLSRLTAAKMATTEVQKAEPGAGNKFKRFEAMDDDFNTPVAIGSLFEGVSEVNKLLAADTRDISLLKRYAHGLELAFDTILGLDLFSRDMEQGGEITGDLVEMLIELRREARTRKDFATSDAIRDRLKGIGVALEDTKEGTRWSIERE